MRFKKIGIGLVASIVGMVLVHPVSAALFEQDFSSSTNEVDYINATPSQNQLTLVNGGPVSIDAGRLKIVNAAATSGNVRRWIDIEGTPVAGMALSFDMEIAVAAGYAANTRLSTGTIGQPNFMAWGIDATGVENEWNVTGAPAVTFTGPQTVTFFLNDSELPRHYTDPAAGTQVLAANSYDVWVGTTQVADGKTGGFVHPENELSKFNIGLSAATAATFYFDNFEVLELSDDEDLTVYEDDFSGAAGVVTAPDVSLAGFSDTFNLTALDGNGFLEGTATNAAANYRFMIDTDPLTDNAAITEIKYTVEMRTPTTEWIMVGFHGSNAPSGFLVGNYNMGPVVQFSPSYVLLRGGTWGGGNTTGALTGYYTPGEEITAEMTYHVAEQTMDLTINGVTVTNGWALNHEFPVGTPSDPVVQWAQIQLRSQPTAANGGARIDRFNVSVVKQELAFDEIVVPTVNLIPNGDLSQMTASGEGNNGVFRIAGAKGQWPGYDGYPYATVTGWTHYNADPNNLYSYTDPGDILDDTDKLSTLFNDNTGSVILNSSWDYRNGMVQTDVLNGASILSGATYELSVEAWKNSSKDQSLTTFTAALTTGADATNLATAVAGSIVQVSPTTTLPTASGTYYTTQVSGSDLLAGQVNVLFESVNTVTISGWTNSVDPIASAEVSQLFVGGISLTLVIQTGDVNKNGVLDQNDIDLAQLYLEGDGGLPATTRQDILIGEGATSAEALLALNLLGFDLNGDDYFDASDVEALDELVYGVGELMLQINVNGSGLDFGWNSRSSRQYDLESSASLVLTNWAAYNDGNTLYINIPGSLTKTNTLIGVQTDGSARFFRVIEKN